MQLLVNRLTFSIVPPKYLKRRNTTINMLKVIDVVYEKGILKPLEKVDLMEGERVKIKIEKSLLFEIVKNYRAYFEDIEDDLTGQLISERR
ncbi:MAG: antitoxin family protein [Halobacteriota archaeon]